MEEDPPAGGGNWELVTGDSGATLGTTESVGGVGYTGVGGVSPDAEVGTGSDVAVGAC